MHRYILVTLYFGEKKTLIPAKTVSVSYIYVASIVPSVFLAIG